MGQKKLHPRSFPERKALLQRHMGEGIDYGVTYSDNLNAGTATVTITAQRFLTRSGVGVFWRNRTGFWPEIPALARS